METNSKSTKKNDKLNTINGSFYEILTKKEGESWNYNYIEQHFLIVGKKGKLFLNEFLNWNHQKNGNLKMKKK